MSTNRTDRAVVYITDEGFLMPSLFSAYQIAERVRGSQSTAVYFITVDAEVPPVIVDELTMLGVRFVEMDKKNFWRRKEVEFNKTHVSITSLGRLAMQQVLPSDIEHVLYLDGDTYIAGDVTPLLQYSAPPGRILAAVDSTWLAESRLSSFWRSHSAYIAGLGLGDAKHYFNAGVLAFRMDTWREFAPRALDFFELNSALCRYHDQSALNATLADRRDNLSPHWNYQSGYAEVHDVQMARPAIYHFTGGMKPWRTPRSIWGKHIYEEYRAFIARHPELGKRHPPAPASAGNAQDAKRGIPAPRIAISRARRYMKAARFRKFLREEVFAI